jgi:alpha-L-fucosidase 2
MGVTLELLHGASPPVQLDAAFGFRAAVQEMLLQSDESALRLLPALPRTWTRGRAAGLRAPGGVRADVEWDGGRFRATLALDAGFPARSVDVFAPGETAPRRVGLEPGGRAGIAT